MTIEGFPGLDVEVADTAFKRMKGLLGRKAIAKNEALLIPRCNAIHTMGMKFPIDVFFLDKNMKTVKSVRNVKPWRPLVWGTWRARFALEKQPANGV